MEVSQRVLSTSAGTQSAKSRQPRMCFRFTELPQQPFDVTPDPAFLYFSPSHREALTSLKEGIEHFRGFMMLVAEPGMGKTTLLNKLMEELSRIRARRVSVSDAVQLRGSCSATS